jgi:hypothetical protein
MKPQFQMLFPLNPLVKAQALGLLIKFLKLVMDCACRIIAHSTGINLHYKKHIPLLHAHVTWQDPIDPRHLCVERFSDGVPLPDGNCHL